MSALLFWDNANNYRATALARVAQNKKAVGGKVVVVTGANGVQGRELTKAFYANGAHVIMAGRTLSKLEKVKADVVAKDDSAEPGTIECMVLDLSDYDSIDAFVKQLDGRRRPVHALINNGGIVTNTIQLSKYGHEMMFQVNFLSQVVLTEKMLPLIEEAGGEGRVVNLGTMSHADAPKPMDFNRIPSTEATFGGYDKDYCESKWLLACYSYQLSKRQAASAPPPPTTSLVKTRRYCWASSARFRCADDAQQYRLDAAKGSSVKSVVADPGISPDGGMWDTRPAWMRFMARYVVKFLTKSPEQAAGCSAHVASVPIAELEGGGYYHSGVLHPPMRPDTTEESEWSKVAALLNKMMPPGVQTF